MNIIQAVAKVTTTKPAVPVTQDWHTMYGATPQGNKSLFELEVLVAKRLELLAWIDQVVNSPVAESFDSILKKIGERLPEERRSLSTLEDTVVLGSSSPENRPSRVSTGPVNGQQSKVVPPIAFDKDEDLTSHLLCRFAFCMSERWRKWYVKTEEILLRARLRLEMEKNTKKTFLADLMEKNGLPCMRIDQNLKENDLVIEYTQYLARDKFENKGIYLDLDNYFAVPMSLATRLIKSRSVILIKGMAILHRNQVQEVFLTVFRGNLNRGLHKAYLSRMKQQHLSEETEKQNVMNMLDAFLEHFIADPVDSLAEGQAGSVRAGDVAALARTHFPPCMRQIDSHLRREGHLKHHGRFMYGLFLKAIGLPLEDALQLFSSLMTVKGGGSLEAFAKSSYGYNIRHHYGMEGKKTSYNTASCTTILNLPPTVDQKDCHGCPFRFRDESRLRKLLQEGQKDVRGKDFGDVHIRVTDVEDIVEDCKGQHYTRACFKYFMATHHNAKRDTLFRSPYEYYLASYEESDPSAQDFSPSKKRRDSAPPLKEDVIKMKQEDQ